MNKNIEELVRLAQENPDTPIVAMVDGEIVAGDEYGWWLGSIGTVSLDEIITAKDDSGVHFKSDDDVFDILERCLTDEEFEALPETEDECRPAYDALPWKKVIMLHINLPEV